MRLAIILKFLLVGGLIVAGTLFLLKGLGVDLPVLKYKGLVVRDVPAGIILLGAAIALAKFWKIEGDRTETEITESPDGRITKKVKTIRVLATGGEQWQSNKETASDHFRRTEHGIALRKPSGPKVDRET
jgi:hypothetical protein